MYTLRHKKTGEIFHGHRGTECSPEWYSCTPVTMRVGVPHALPPEDVDIIYYSVTVDGVSEPIGFLSLRFLQAVYHLHDSAVHRIVRETADSGVCTLHMNHDASGKARNVVHVRCVQVAIATPL